MKTIKALAQLLLLLSTLAVGTVRADVLLDVTDQIAAGDPSQLGRLSRNNILQDWFGSEPFPGSINPAVSYKYRTYTVPVGLTPYIQVMINGASTNIFASAYATAYTPATSFSTNWLGDAGTSGRFFGVDALYFNVVGPINGNLVVVVAETTPGAGVGQPYRLIVEGYADANFSPVVVPGGGISLVSNANPAAAGSPITLTATVTGSVTPPSGIVRFDDAGVTIPGCAGAPLSGSGLSRTAQCVTTLAPGTHSLRATFLPDGRGGVTQVSDPLTQAVNPRLTTTTTVASSQNPSIAKTAIALTATVTGSSPTGTVAFVDVTSGSTTLPGCAAVPVTGAGNARTAVCNTAALPAGARTVNANYGGDAANAPSSGSIVQTVNACTGRGC